MEGEGGQRVDEEPSLHSYEREIILVHQVM